jgi:isocitrate dehydrogenase (NAD+)
LAKHTVTFIPGDGIGPEVSDAARRCVEATGVHIDFEEVHAGADTLEETGTVLPDSVIDSIRKNKVAIKGPITTPVGSGFRSVNVALRKINDLYACVRPCKTYKGVNTRYNNIDLVIMRENTEDLYAGIEFEFDKPETKDLISKIESISDSQIRKDSGISIKPISVTGTRRIVKFAFDYSLAHGRKKVTAVHKANIMKFSDGLFLKTAREVAREYEGKVEFEDKIVDNMCMQLVQRPENFDVLVLPNLYGDIISDLCAGLIGGLGVAPGANIGDDIALFEATHGSAPKYKGKNKVNPCAMIFSAVLMLDYLKEKKAAKLLEQATAEIIQEGRSVTYDFKTDKNDPAIVGTREMADAIIERINKLKNA